MGIDQGWPCDNAEPSHDGGIGVPVQLVGWLTSAVHALTAAVSVITNGPAMLLEFRVTLAGTFGEFMGVYYLLHVVPWEAWS